MSISVSNIYPGELTIRAPQHEIERLVTNCRCDGIEVEESLVSNGDRPTPLGLPEWDFRPASQAKASPLKSEPTPVTVTNDGNANCLGLPEWTFGEDPASAEVATAEATVNSEGYGDKPTPIPEYRWDF